MSPRGAVFYYSDHGECRRIAEYLAERCKLPCFDITALCPLPADGLRTAVTVFPVYCQSPPAEVRAFLSAIDAQRHVLLAAYGRMSFGNALQEASRIVGDRVIAAAYLPVAHLYRKDDARFSDFSALDPIASIVQCEDPAFIRIPKYRKQPFASFFPAWRSRVGVGLKRTSACDACGACSKICPHGAMQHGLPDRRCERCLRCVGVCPQGALKPRFRLFLRMYLKKEKETRLIVYIK